MRHKGKVISGIPALFKDFVEGEPSSIVLFQKLDESEELPEHFSR